MINSYRSTADSTLLRTYLSFDEKCPMIAQNKVGLAMSSAWSVLRWPIPQRPPVFLFGGVHVNGTGRLAGGRRENAVTHHFANPVPTRPKIRHIETLDLVQPLFAGDT